MSTFMKIMLVPALVVAFSVGVALAASGVGGGDDSSSPLAQFAPSTDDSTTTLETTTGADTTTGLTTTSEDGLDLEPGEDVSGPCDEAENVNDPRCTGVGDDREDNSGPGNGHDDDDDDNSGPGNGDDHDNDRGGHDDEGDDD
jgi:hypothetical protein